jgi:hypothetical protein
LRELAGEFYKRAVCEVVLGRGVVVMEQVTCGSRCDGGDGVDGGNGGGCATKGAWVVVVLCKGGSGAVVGGGARVRGHG